MSFRVRPMVRGDIEQVSEIERAIHEQPWSKRVFRDELAGADRDYFVAVDVAVDAGRDAGSGAGSDVVGYAGVFTVLDETHLATVGVRPDRRREGIAAALVVELVHAARRRGAQAMTLEVRASNSGAQELYRRFGFGPVGIRPSYYTSPAPAEDAVIMWVHDIAGVDMDERLARLGSSPGCKAGSDE